MADRNRSDAITMQSWQMIKGTITGTGILTSSISKAKITPAMGALKMAEIPAAAPHAKRRVRSFKLKRSQRAVLLPIAEPVAAIGASSPAEPPKPTVRILLSICEYNLSFSTKLDFLDIV